MTLYHCPADNILASAYTAAVDRYAQLGVDAEAAVQRALTVPISLHCWQADDVRGLESAQAATDGGGIMATGNYPGRARHGDDIRQDLEQVMALAPGTLRVNLHACYAETGDDAVDRDQLEARHFARWMDWARDGGFCLDFNPTYFAHARANSGYTLSNADAGIRDFWIAHGIASRRIAEVMGHAQESPCVNNHWVPDGAKDSPADRWGPRARLAAAYDQIFAADLHVDPKGCIDSLESKLFGLGSEDYVVGSMEFYTGYCLSRGILQCLDMGHYHPTEVIHDKLSALLQFHERLVLHTSRPVRWDSDHVVLFNDDVRNVFLELVRGQALDRAIVALDFFDASIQRVLAYVIGARATRKAILSALLDPTAALQQLEAKGQLGPKLGLMEEQRSMPFGAVWDMLCLQAGAPPAAAWIPVVEQYEQTTLASRS
ncbi:MAG: L-rhamnose isomerase [Verrucomicrobia bacterium]|nr:L-rhamnose isomerase [Verrucomicrobiota bacterium]